MNPFAILAPRGFLAQWNGVTTSSTGFRYNKPMQVRLSVFLLLLLTLTVVSPAYSQTATLREIHTDGLKVLTEPQVVTLSGLTTGSQVGRTELQDAADALVRCGLFAKVNYNFTTRNDGVVVTFHLEENPRLPVFYDNFPWYADAELNDAIHKDLPYFDGTLPAAGAAVDLANTSLQNFLTAKGINGTVEHLVVASPLSDGSVQQFRIDGVTPQIASLEFSDPQLTSSAAVQQHLAEVRGKPYSRMTIDVFLSEQIRPIYLQAGYLKATIGPPEVRLSGNPNQKFPDQIPVFVPSQPGAVYHWKDVTWSGNKVLSTITLTNDLGLKTGDVANGMNIEGGWDRVHEEYGQQGYLEAKLDPVSTFDDAQHTVSYAVSVSEGKQYRYNAMTISGLSLAAERIVRDAWPIKPGEVFDKKLFDQLLTSLELHHQAVFKDLPLHYETVGHWLQTDPDKGTVDILLDFK
jgi:outer membrane protein assembly factor BamA